MAGKLRSDGDVIRGLGFVTLYSAYAEEQADCLLDWLSPIQDFDDTTKRLPISKKLKHALKIVETLGWKELRDLKDVLRHGPGLFERRNEVVHGRIYARHKRPAKLKSSRPNVSDREIESEELYELANDFMNYRAALHRPTLSDLHRLIRRYDVKK